MSGFNAQVCEVQSPVTPLNTGVRGLFSGIFHGEVFTPDRRGRLRRTHSWRWHPGLSAPNGITNVGIEDNESVYFNSGTQKTAWYLGLIDNASYSALAGSDTMASHGGWVEATAYDEAVRQLFSPLTPSGRIIASSSAAVFTISATVTIKGAFLVSNSTKSGTTGILWSTGLFTAAQALIDNQVLRVSYTLTGTSGS